MNKIYDKLLLAVAALLLAGGIFLYLQKSGQAPSLTAPINVETAENPFETEVVPSTEATEASWPEPPLQSTGWRYDVFTPPKIFIDENGQFTSEGYEPQPEAPPFGVYLAAIERKPYRLQLEGYIEEDRTDPSKTLLLFFDEESQAQIRARPGAERPQAEFNVLEFDVQRIRDEAGNIDVVAKATILDQRSGQEVVLVHGERKFETGFTVVVRSRLDTSFQKELTEAPTEFVGPAGQYTLLEINLEESSVTIEKEASEDEEPDVRTLSVDALDSASPEPETSPSNDIQVDGGFDLDSLF